jgi:hypothetical protein
MTSDKIFVLNFHDVKLPTFGDSRGTAEYIPYGNDNMFGDYLLHLFSKSAKHGSIISGKADYIFGKGFDNGDFKVNVLSESLNDVLKKCVIDLSLFGGFRLELVFDLNGLISEMYHVDFTSLRVAKDNSGYYYCSKWKKYSNDPKFIKSFSETNREGSCIYAYNEYRPGVKHYPLPEYIHSANYIELDIEISKYYLSAIKNGMIPSKMVQFFNGNPTDEQKRNIERRMIEKTTGTENGGKILMVFNNAGDKPVEISDLSATDLDKHFIEMNKLVQQEIFSGHKVTTPALFGIKTEGQLGSSQELKTGYAIFLSAYAIPKAKIIEKEFNYLLTFSRNKGQYNLRQIDPVGWEVPDSMIPTVITQDEARERLGLKALNIAPTASSEADSIIPASVNEHVKNLTGRQNQQLLRVVRQFQQGKITLDIAKTLLRNGLGLNDIDIEKILGVSTQLSENEEDIDFDIGVFASFGEEKNGAEIISQHAAFSISENFDTSTLTASENKIIALIKKDPLIPAKDIAKAIGESERYVEGVVKSFIDKEYLQINAAGELLVVKKIKLPLLPKSNGIKVMYSYEGVRDSSNRKFCAKLLSLDRFYSRKDIERMSEILGYSVFERRGGFWNNKGTILAHCRHSWKANVVKLKA